jgi:hypothetical protein
MLLLIFASALKAQINLNMATEDYSNLKVTEINYHPKDLINGFDTTSGGDFEFIEFKNIGETPINLTGLVLDSAVYYEFPSDISLGPKQFWVVASKPTKFLEFYGMEPTGNFSGSLSNSGEEILVHDALGNKVIDFTYDDHNPWPESPDGGGYTLVSAVFNPTTDPNDEAYWRSSLKLYGSPFHDDDITLDFNTSVTLNNQDLRIYPNPASEYIKISLKGINESQRIDIKIYKVNGSLVYQSDIVNNEMLNLNNLNIEYGLYFIKIESDNLVETSKFIYSK